MSERQESRYRRALDALRSATADLRRLDEEMPTDFGPVIIALGSAVSTLVGIKSVLDRCDADEVYSAMQKGK